MKTKKNLIFYFLLVTIFACTTILLCKNSISPAAEEKKGKIWKEGPVVEEKLSQNFNPQQSFAPLIKKLKPAVVNIYTTQVIKKKRYHRFQPSPFPSPFEEFFGDDFFEKFFGENFPEQQFERHSLGSGFIISKDGYILTNNHVVEKATKIHIKTEGGEDYEAKVVGKDEKYDLALLKIKTKKGDTPIVSFGDSDKLEVGDWVIAIGNPFGLSHTVTAGIVSAKDRVIGAGPYDDFIQTDASINPGNSGGPLFNIRGEVVGINTAIHAAGQGIGFTVPINMAKKFIEDILTKGKITRGWLGVGIQNISEEIAKQFGASVSSGALVTQVFPKTPAEKAGIKRGDIIVEYNGKEVKNVNDLTRLVGTTTPGEKTQITIIRGEERIKIPVQITERKEGEEVSREFLQPSEESSEEIGLVLSNIDKELARKLNIEPHKGVFVREVLQGSAADDAGIQEGDVIVEVNRQVVNSVDEFKEIIKKIIKGDSVLILLYRNGSYLYTVLKKKD